MSGYARHLLSQRRGLAALAGLLLTGRSTRAGGPLVTAPGPVTARTVPPPSSVLCKDFLRFSGGDPASYRGVVPPHLFPQWSLPVMLEAARALPYPATKVLNAGCGLTVHSALPLGQDLNITARVSKIDDNGRRALVTIEVITGTADVQRALTADLRLFIPLKREGTADTRAGSDASKPRQKPTVPLDVKELGFQRFGKDAGLDFAFLTGDFNPIHWLSPYAKASGFNRVILHGFGSFARAFDGLVRAALAGDARALTALDANFTRPLPLPAEVGLYLGPEQQVYLGDAPGGAAYLVGHFSWHSP